MFDRLEGIWNAFRNALLVWEFLKSLNFGRLETFESWNIFGTFLAILEFLFLVDAKFCFCKNNKRIIIIIKSTTDMVQIRIISVSKNFEPPPTLGTDGPELEFPACGTRAHTHKHPGTESGSPPVPSSLCDL